MPTSVTSTFFSLASALDIGFLLSGLPAVGIPLVMGDAEAQEDMFYLTYVLYVSRYVTNTARKVIVCVTTLMSIDRYLVVAFPMKRARVMKLRVVSKIVVRDGEAFSDLGERLDIHCEHHRPKDGPLGDAELQHSRI
nr:hypothetical protein BaRGS_019691 [Batillaria attramentaria]